MAELRAMDIHSGDVVLVHASLRRLGRVVDGVGTVLASLREVIGPEGTLVVPTFTSSNSDTSRVHANRTRGMTPSDLLEYRACLPPFDAETTPSIECGLLTERVRSQPGAVRSRHPQTSFAALGPAARLLMSDHDPADHLGESSPLAKLYMKKAQVLLLGVAYESCTAFHLAEYRYSPSPPRTVYGCMIETHSGPRWWQYEDVVLDDRDFGECGLEMEGSVPVVKGRVGDADSRCFSLVEAVDFAESWLRRNRLNVGASISSYDGIR
ncbi:aminoglycoside N(3)-acetyltransferase [Sphaerisporangium aureirubrum]|uniref:Aminoglycoside N(3)-acetyltransferase n=1 Tax=Sphaerisporangium aureirubrum TaxID=1544736 RepID=A0ABW1NIA6_9ACTN